VSSPVNIQQSVLQSFIAERVQQVQQQHPDMQQRYFEHHLGQERIKKMHKVNDFDKMDNIRFKENEEQRKRKEKNSNRDAETRDPDVEASMSQEQSGRIDVKA